MKIIILIGLSLMGVACAQTKMKMENSSGPMVISQGEVRWIEFPLSSNEAKLNCHGHDVKYVKKGNLGLAFVTESYFSDLAPFSCKVSSNGIQTSEFNFIVKERHYHAEVLKVDPKKIKLAPKDEKRVIAEQIVLNKIYDSSVSDFLFTEAFMPPLNSTVTSVYGNKRVYNKKKKGQHLGIDYRAAIGDKVPAANAGKIVFSDDVLQAKIAMPNCDGYIGVEQLKSSAARLILMSKADAIIGSNSTFGWWAAYLSEAQSKFKIFPDPWFKDAKINPKDLVPLDWTRVKH